MAEEIREGQFSKWHQMRRLEFIDFRLTADGRINRRDLVDFFGLSIPQATLDFSRYQQMAGEAEPPRKNLVYDRHVKGYIRTEDFKPLFPKVCSPDSYLRDLMAISHGDLLKVRAYFGFVPNVAVACFGPVNKAIDPVVMSNLLCAIHGRKAVHIVYLDETSINPVDCLIAPHGLAFDGLRWRIRAYCYDSHAFKDYVLLRITRCDVPEVVAPNDRVVDPMVEGFKEVGTSGRDDREWNDLVDLVLKVNPDLPEPQKRALEREYGMQENGTVVYPCRRALLPYALKWLNLTKENALTDLLSKELVLDNEAEVFRRLAGGN